MLALSILVLSAACMARSGELAAGGSDASATASPRSPLYDRQRERLLKERLEAEAQQKKSLDGLTEDELFKELGEALSVERRNAILLKIYREGSLEAADRIEVLAAGIRAGEPGQPNVPSATLLEYFAAEIRFRHTGDRKYRVRALLIVTNPADETFGSSPSRPHTKEIVQQGIVEARSNLVRLLDRDKKNRTEGMAWAMDREIENTRRAIMFLDIWEQAKTAEETFVRAVEQNDYLPLKPCAVDQLIKLDQVSDSTRRRVREALMPHVEAALERVKTRERTAISTLPPRPKRQARLHRPSAKVGARRRTRISVSSARCTGSGSSTRRKN